MTTRQRTITDDVIEAMQRGVDHEYIRKLGEYHALLTDAYAQFRYHINGPYGSPYLHKLAREILGADVYSELDEIMETGPLIEETFSVIRFRLTGHRDDEIEK